MGEERGVKKRMDNAEVAVRTGGTGFAECFETDGLRLTNKVGGKGDVRTEE